MILDLNQIKSSKSLDADVCIVGAGAAGITLAKELANSGLSVCLLESGGFEYDEDTQLLYEGTSTGIDYDVLLTRLRYFGGTTNHWGGTCRELDAIDFENRPWVPHSGWPIKKADLADFYSRAISVCKVEGLNKKLARRNPPPFLDKDHFIPLHFVSNPLNFGETYREAITRSRNITTVLNANVQSIETNAAGNRVTHVLARSLTGTRLVMRAKVFVLACGGIENPRLLLLSTKTHPHGLGNQYGNVGRFFQEHIYFHLVGLVVFNEKHRPFTSKAGNNYIYDFGIAESAQRKKGLLNSSFQGSPAKLPDLAPGIDSAKAVLKSIKSLDWPDNPLGHAKNIVSDIDDVAETVYRQFIRKELRPFNMNHWAERDIQPMDIKYTMEQIPNPDSRITLSSDKDHFGLPKVKLNWKFVEADKKNMQQSLLYLGAEVGRLSAGRFWIRPRINFNDDKAWPFPHGVGCHHIGTTRMHDDPRHGVVDRNCAVHGVPNLYIAGSSVFTTSGVSNPTLTIVALALRLADHLKATGRKS